MDKAFIQNVRNDRKELVRMLIVSPVTASLLNCVVATLVDVDKYVKPLLFDVLPVVAEIRS